MLRKKQNPEDLVPTPLTVTLRAHIIKDLKEMEKHSHQTIDELVTKALSMFIATHSDYLGKSGR